MPQSADVAFSNSDIAIRACCDTKPVDLGIFNLYRWIRKAEI